ncbi:ATP-dependent endonuclease [Exiguobacterium sp. SH0S2]|uniref:ATP-dependent nuclease n=1 Tax=Exiguobacterium sp. SH0S2 TaxID=2510950 RepID=UPI0010406AEF|nr:ATP-binding cassette domain-containing protein [Exiguobacterium sp. SH0S2]TCI62852.1 ATP-binding cassette domain-containing protein [Exiguobacterium sp. SH0S2]
MRSAEINDYWSRLESKKAEFKTGIAELSITSLGMLHSDRIAFDGQLIAICGRNGVGKSTLLSSLIAVLDPIYFQSNAYRQKKVNESSFVLKVLYDNKNHSISYPQVGLQEGGANEAEEAQGEELNFSSMIIDTSNHCTELLSYFTKQSNLSELIEPAPSKKLNPKELKELSFILNKDISNCYIYDIEVDDDRYIPYFEIEYSGHLHGTEILGLGEIAAIYIYSSVKNLAKHSYLIIEEPETYLSYQTQENLINVLAKYTVEKKLCTIITSHSHAIVNRIPAHNIVYVSRTGSRSKVKKPKNKYWTLKSLGMPLTVPIIFCVEDNVAKTIVTNIFNRYNLNSQFDYLVITLGGVENIKNTLKVPHLSILPSRIIGIFDGDQNGKITGHYSHPFTFLPGLLSPENQFKDLILSQIDVVSYSLQIDSEKLEEVLTALEGFNEHDWLIELCRDLSISQDIFIDKMINILLENNKEDYDDFISQVSNFCT